MPSSPGETGDSRRGKSRALNVPDTTFMEGVGKQTKRTSLSETTRKSVRWAKGECAGGGHWREGTEQRTLQGDWELEKEDTWANVTGLVPAFPRSLCCKTKSKERVAICTRKHLRLDSLYRYVGFIHRELMKLRNHSADTSRDRDKGQESDTIVFTELHHAKLQTDLF